MRQAVSVIYRVMLLMAATLLFCCGRVSTQQQEDSVICDTVAEAEISDLTDEAIAWADSVNGTLTLRQKVSQMFLPALYARDDYWTVRQLAEYADSCVGGVMLLKGDSECAAFLADTVQRRGHVPAFVAIDAEWGLAMRLTDAPEFPANGNISKEAGDQLMYDYGRELARECRLIGINMVLGPVVDVSVPGGFMRRRSFGDDPVRVADLGVAYARGLEDGNVISVAKHFPGHGSVSADSHVRKGIIRRSLTEMDSIDLYPFKRWAEECLSAVMVGHLAVPSIDPEMRPAAVSRPVITGLLRDTLGFTGLVLTDALNMGGVRGYDAADAVIAGADIIVAPRNTNAEISKVMKAIGEGRISASEIEEHVHRILLYKYLAGVGRRNEESERGVLTLASARADSISQRLRR